MIVIPWSSVLYWEDEFDIAMKPDFLEWVSEHEQDERFELISVHGPAAIEVHGLDQVEEVVWVLYWGKGPDTSNSITKTVIPRPYSEYH